MKNAFRAYHKKRDFRKTSEPSGVLKKRKNKVPIFVVQEHHASHLHYDLRLELDGVLKSWAVPKGPSLNPKDKRLAVEVEDHPLAYANFHGTIPKGEYGAGKVIIWDRGTWTMDKDPHAGLRNGKLEFTLHGRKLHGKFVLVRLLDSKSSKKNWLLMKRMDEDADGKFAQMPGFIFPQLATLVETPPTSAKWLHEIKLDGYRLQLHLKDRKVTIFTRNAQDWSDRFPTLSNALSSLKANSAIFDGEAVVMDASGRSNFGGLQSALSSHDHNKIRLYLFDLLYLNGEDLRPRPLKERKALLLKLIGKAQAPLFYSEEVRGHGSQFLKRACQYHLEGIVSKDREAPYTSGRSRIWCKSKCGQRQEFVIAGFTTGKGARSSGPGALLLGVYDRIRGKKILRYTGKVGTGFDFKTLAEVKQKLARLEVGSSPFGTNVPKEKNIHWVKPKLVAEVNFSEWTADKLLRTPVFLGLREDKPSKQIVQEKAIQVHLTHPDKILFPAEKITKKMIADYYDEVAPLMLPLIENRPLSLVRCPSGAHKKCFYQKHPGEGKVPPYLVSFKVRKKSNTSRYMALESAPGLKGLVQMNAFEIHTWNCHYQNLLQPDQIVLDFDPDPSVSFKSVIAGCLAMKKTLDRLKLKSFVKVTGGKGLHIHIPIEPIYSWEQVKAFSKVLADEMALRHPKKFTSNLSKQVRGGKIFVDYLRNDYDATAVAPYSLRALGNRKFSSVALPISWSELPRLKSSDQFTLEKALQKIKRRRTDPWEKFLSVKQKIAILDATC
ncbi:MAG: DNA ligase D [Bdellovibrionales bacterium GWA2_49_15]|nr:MAG: DNA ligase D [Bdellovibrionales bacterium GWA2_49_15]HAZ14093.1 DNA ligase D [Bdellovibrionales bacterium]